jgi:hypothetical protein
MNLNHYIHLPILDLVWLVIAVGLMQVVVKLILVAVSEIQVWVIRRRAKRARADREHPAHAVGDRFFVGCDQSDVGNAANFAEKY